MGISTLVAFVIGPLLLFCFIRFGWRLMPVGLGALVLGVLGMGMMYVSLGNMAQDDAAQGNVPALALIGFGLMGLAFLTTILLGVVFIARRISGDK